MSKLLRKTIENQIELNTIIEQQKEIERLNNIINELEKDAEKIISAYGKGKYKNSYELGLLEYAETDLRKLQELKGDGSNER